jgi:hypothetical protein
MLSTRGLCASVRLHPIHRAIANQPKRHQTTTFIKSPHPATHKKFSAIRPFKNNQTQHYVNSLENFEYSPLEYDAPPTARPVVRVLELFPGNESDPVEIAPKEEHLKENLRYEAISYCWGNPSGRSPIFCHGRLLLVPRKLEVALRNIHDPKHSKIFWADAICINQSDNMENDSQVQFMRKIFSYAERTLIRLGDASGKRRQQKSKFAILSIKCGLTILDGE